MNEDHPSLARDTIPPSPVRDTANPPSPARVTVNPPNPSKCDDDDVVITGFGHFEPGNPIALSKHSAKDELTAFGKGKWNADLATYAALNPQDLHSGYLNWLYTSREYEAGLVNMMKDKYEVNSI